MKIDISMNIIITGASRGIGHALTKLFCADRKNTVVAISRNKQKLDELANELINREGKARFYPIAFDLTKRDYKTLLLPNILKVIGTVDILINNAGLLVTKPFAALSDSDFDNVFDVNVKSVFKLSRDLLPYFNKLAHIVNISSMGGVQGSAKFPGLSLYSASKGAVSILTECMAEELKEHQIKVNALAIGAVQTEMLAEAFPGYQAPLQPDEMATFIMDFALNGHRFFNGKILPVSVSTP